mmetsp:Transcript_30378/g.97152  ORF Transcript_30378/g.97152 Transcript_30378/m.97152 type:complete len:317 (-) Transcript_30378:87-1037(-)
MQRQACMTAALEVPGRERDHPHDGGRQVPRGGSRGLKRAGESAKTEPGRVAPLATEECQIRPSLRSHALGRHAAFPALPRRALDLHLQKGAIRQLGSVEGRDHVLGHSRVDVVHKAIPFAAAILIQHGAHAVRWDGAKGRKDVVEVQIGGVRWQATNPNGSSVILPFASRQSLSHLQTFLEYFDGAVTFARALVRTLEAALGTIGATLAVGTIPVVASLAVGQPVPHAALGPFGPLGARRVRVLHLDRCRKPLRNVAVQVVHNPSCLLNAHESHKRGILALSRQNLGRRDIPVRPKDLLHLRLVNVCWQVRDEEIV